MVHPKYTWRVVTFERARKERLAIVAIVVDATGGPLAIVSNEASIHPDEGERNARRIALNPILEEIGRQIIARKIDIGDDLYAPLSESLRIIDL